MGKKTNYRAVKACDSYNSCDSLHPTPLHFHHHSVLSCTAHSVFVPICDDALLSPPCLYTKHPFYYMCSSAMKWNFKKPFCHFVSHSWSQYWGSCIVGTGQFYFKWIELYRCRILIWLILSSQNNVSSIIWSKVGYMKSAILLIQPCFSVGFQWIYVNHKAHLRFLRCRKILSNIRVIKLRSYTCTWSAIEQGFPNSVLRSPLGARLLFCPRTTQPIEITNSSSSFWQNQTCTQGRGGTMTEFGKPCYTVLD